MTCSCNILQYPECTVKAAWPPLSLSAWPPWSPAFILCVPDVCLCVCSRRLLSVFKLAAVETAWAESWRKRWHEWPPPRGVQRKGSVRGWEELAVSIPVTTSISRHTVGIRKGRVTSAQKKRQRPIGSSVWTMMPLPPRWTLLTAASWIPIS